jgi:hypothetical protein
VALAKVSPDVSKYEDALTWFQKRTVITGAQARDVDDRLKHEAFWVGNGLQLDAIQRVHDKITKAIEQGQSLEDFKKAVKDELRNPAHTETVFRNATQRAYNAGRWSQMTQPTCCASGPSVSSMPCSTGARRPIASRSTGRCCRSKTSGG